MLWRRIVRFLAVAAAVLLLTVLTQIGGVVLLIALAIGAVLPVRRVGRGLAVALVFIAAYAATSTLVVPPLAAMGGRVPMPCLGEPLRTLPLLCALNRHYVSPRLLALAKTMATDLEHGSPGTVTVALDANVPFLDGFPLLPHLSHDDGDKLDLAYFYARDGAYQPGATRSPIGYWAFEQPAPGEDSHCEPTALSLRWDMRALQPLFADLQIDKARTRAALDWLVRKGQNYGLQRVFIEPYLAARLGVSSPLIGFQGCRAARHDDHIHLQIASD